MRTDFERSVRRGSAAILNRIHHISRLLPSLRILGVLLGVFLGTLPIRAQAQQEIDQSTEILVVPLHEQISTTHQALVQRALRQARSQGIPWLVLDIDTPGGRIDYTRELEAMLSSIREDGVETVAFVRRMAGSAGAYVALACDRIYMRPNAQIGGATPVVLDPTGGIMEIPDDDARRKSYVFMRKTFRALAERRGEAAGTARLDEGALRIVEAMVDPYIELVRVSYRGQGGFLETRILDVEDVRSMESRGEEVTVISRYSRPVILNDRESEEVGLSMGTVNSLQQLAEVLGVDDNRMVRLDENWSEHLVSWLDGLKPVLFLLGFLLLVVELKTPGFAVAGGLGVLFLAMALFSSYLVGLASITEILLFFAGLVGIAVEIFVMPGVLIFGGLGLLSMAASLVLSQQDFIWPQNELQQTILTTNLVNLLLLLGLVLAGTLLLWRLLPKVPLFNRVLLPPPEDETRGTSTRFTDARGQKLMAMVGRTGQTATALRPTGIVELDGERFDVVSTGDFIDRDITVRILKIDQNRIVVEAVDAVGAVASQEAPESAPEEGAALVFFLLILGFVFVLAEVFFPSLGILGIAAAVSLVSSIFLSFQEGQGFGFLVLSVVALGVPVVLFFAFKKLPDTPIGRRLILTGPDSKDVRASGEEPGLAELLYQAGSTLSPLRPSGFARIAGKRVDVVTRGEMLGQGVDVVVVEVEGNRVVVATPQRAADAGAPASPPPPESPPAAP